MLLFHYYFICHNVIVLYVMSTCTCFSQIITSVVYRHTTRFRKVPLARQKHCKHPSLLAGDNRSSLAVQGWRWGNATDRSCIYLQITLDCLCKYKRL